MRRSLGPVEGHMTPSPLKGWLWVGAPQEYLLLWPLGGLVCPETLIYLGITQPPEASRLRRLPVGVSRQQRFCCYLGRRCILGDVLLWVGSW